MDIVNYFFVLVVQKKKKIEFEEQERTSEQSTIPSFPIGSVISTPPGEQKGGTSDSAQNT